MFWNFFFHVLPSIVILTIVSKKSLGIILKHVGYVQKAWISHIFLPSYTKFLDPGLQISQIPGPKRPVGDPLY